ncbi:MAG: aminotransferase class I/II-fold pyridoxal phosphate-dependent enzyme, partial [Verrucomicrobiota bacterium]
AVGTLGALLEEKDVVILDKLSHASLIDGAKLSGAVLRVFPHNHLGKLENLVQGARSLQPNTRVLIVTESIFSMDGDRAILDGIVEIKNRYGALLLLDEAHAVGVAGDHGRGLADELGVTGEVDIQMGTLSKALGVSGGYICGSRSLIDLLINRSRSFIYSTAPPPALAAAAAAAVDLLMSAAGAARQQKLWSNLELFDRTLGDSLPRMRPPQSAIIPVVIGEESAAMGAAQALREQGFLVPAIRYPTVARGTARLRVTLSANHTPEQILGLCEALLKLKRG